MIEICQFGAGRIGRMHAENLSRHPAYRLRYVVDVHEPSARAVAEATGATVARTEQALADPAIAAVLIASSTDTHADLIEAAARAGKAILCEKPIDLSRARVDACLEVADRAGVPLMVGFNRRFDGNFGALKRTVEEGRIGQLELVSITSRDPGPPPAAYIEVSGGLYRDMMIHDFDLARWLLGEEPTEVFAAGSCLVDPEIGRLGDVDTALVVLKTGSGKLAQISCSRRASYGYDQRLEVHGSKGMARAENVRLSSVEVADDAGWHGEKPPHFFIERYAQAYRSELDHFAACVQERRMPSPSGEDGRRALALADAAVESLAVAAPSLRPEGERAVALHPDLSGKVALVTGASRGIGRAIAVLLAEAGADVAVNFRERTDEAHAVVETIGAGGRRARAMQADVSLGAEVADLVARVEAELAPIDILVNNAGVSEPCTIEDLTEEIFERTLKVNLTAAFLCTQAVLPGMRARGFGRIVNISSGAARGAGAVGVHYNASKAGMEGMTRGYAARVVKDGVTVNAVAPSLIATEMIKPHRLDNLPNIPVGRLGTTEEIASVVLMVVGNAYMTGQTVAANGGLHFG